MRSKLHQSGFLFRSNVKHIAYSVCTNYVCAEQFLYFNIQNNFTFSILLSFSLAISIYFLIGVDATSRAHLFPSSFALAFLFCMYNFGPAAHFFPSVSMYNLSSSEYNAFSLNVMRYFSCQFELQIYIFSILKRNAICCNLFCHLFTFHKRLFFSLSIQLQKKKNANVFFSRIEFHMFLFESVENGCLPLIICVLFFSIQYEILSNISHCVRSIFFLSLVKGVKAKISQPKCTIYNC